MVIDIDFSKPKDETAPMLAEVAKHLNDNTRRIRLVEEQLENVDMRANTIEKNYANDTQVIRKDLLEIQEELRDLRETVTNITIDIKKINKRLTQLVSRKEVKEIQEYVELILPITSKFVTKKEAEEMIKGSENETKV